MDPGAGPRRIHIVGGPGGGKSVLARRLAAELSLPVFELDRMAFEGPDMSLRPLNVRKTEAHGVAVRPEWISEGIFLGWTEELLQAADVIIWLDYVNWWTAFRRILARFLRGGLQEVQKKRGVEKFARFRDYWRHLRQLIGVFRSSRTYYYGPVSSTPENHRTLSRSTTGKVLAPYARKVIHCTGNPDVHALLARYQPHLAVGELPLVSIIINNYDYARFLPDAIDSALEQTYPATEVIVVDDGSTDESRDVIAGYGDQIVPVLKDNEGQASAFNAGFSRSRGSIVIFLDADDMLLPRTVAHVVTAFQDNDNVAKAQYRMEIIRSDGMPTGLIKPASHLPLRSGDLHREFLTFPEDMTWMATSGNAFSRRALARLMPVPVGDGGYGPVGADWYLAHLIPLLGNIVFLDIVGAYYRVHDCNRYDRAELSLEQIRRTIQYMRNTHPHIRRLAQQMGMSGAQLPEPRLTSVAFIAHRLISLKLEPEYHSMPGDTLWALLRQGVMASARRFDTGLPMKVLYVLWLLLMVIAPRPLAAALADRFLYPEKRPRMNRLLSVLHDH